MRIHFLRGMGKSCGCVYSHAQPDEAILIVFTLSGKIIIMATCAWLGMSCIYSESLNSLLYSLLHI